MKKNFKFETELGSRYESSASGCKRYKFDGSVHTMNLCVFVKNECAKWLLSAIHSTMSQRISVRLVRKMNGEKTFVHTPEQL